jgi:hypothetical protein
MKIVSRQQFLDMPSGTIFRDYRPCVFGDLKIKGDTIRGRLMDGTCTDDFNVLHIDFVDAPGSVEAFNLLDRAEKTGESFSFDYEGWMQNGWSPSENQKLYAVYEFRDFEQLVSLLQRCVANP